MKELQKGLIIRVNNAGKLTSEDFECEYGDFEKIENAIDADTCDVLLCTTKDSQQFIMYCDEKFYAKELDFNNLGSYLYNNIICGDIIIFGVKQTGDGPTSRSLNGKEFLYLDNFKIMMNNL